MKQAVLSFLRRELIPQAPGSVSMFLFLFFFNRKKYFYMSANELSVLNDEKSEDEASLMINCACAFLPCKLS